MSESPGRQSITNKPWFYFVLGWSISTAILLPIADKVGYWTSAFPVGVLVGAFTAVTYYVRNRSK